MQGAFPNIADPKKNLRAAMRRIAATAPRDSAAVVAAVQAWLAANPGPRTLAVFAALPGEVDLASVVASHPARRWVFPRVADDDLRFHHVTNPAADLAAGAYGVMEPLPALPMVDLTEIDVFFCPGLAFDPHGGRLGRGKGFYDRLLSRSRLDALRIGVCFPWQIVPDTHHQPHDVSMDVVING